MSGLLDSLQDGFKALPSQQVDANGQGDARRAALAAALANGLPTHRNESWKYTSLRALAARTFTVSNQPAPIDSTLLDAIPPPRMVFVNGNIHSALSQLDGLPSGISFAPLSADTSHPEHTQPCTAIHGTDVFRKLNQALAFDGVRIRVSAGTESTTPLQLVFISTPCRDDLAIHLQHRIELAENAKAIVVEHHLCAASHRHLLNHNVDVSLANGAKLQHARIQNEDQAASLIAHTHAMLEDSAEYRRVDLELGAALSRHELNVQLHGKSAQMHSGGVLFADARRHVDTRLSVEHIGRDTACHLLWRGLADARGRAVFHGGILIQAGADGSDANLSNKNLLLSELAEIDSQPVLEIHADEVKAAHGATIGRLDATAMFYLRSRGIPEKQARALLIDAFLREPLAQLGLSSLEPILVEKLSARLHDGGH